MRYVAILAGIGLLLAVTGTAGATTYDFTLYPSDLAGRDDFLNGRGGEPFGYDPDMPPPIGVYVPGPTGFGDSSWWSDVQGSAAGGPRDYTSFRLSPRDILGSVSSLTISDLDAVSYWTKNMDTSKIDWQLKIYTEGDATHWYGYRFNFTRPANGDNDWHLSSTDDNLLVNDIYDKWLGTVPSVPGTGLLSDLDTAYGSQEILFIDIIASYASDSPPVDSYLDGVSLSLDGGDEATMDLAVPEPVTMAGLMLGIGCLARYVRKRRTL